MNPLDMTGPEFLRFYLIWGLGGLLLAFWVRSSWLNRLESQAEARRWIPGYYPQDSDAYAVALLRGGRPEAVRTLLARLVSGGFAAPVNGEIRKLPAGGAAPGLLPIERRALATLGGQQSVNDALFSLETAVEPELRAMENDLARQGLALSAEQKKSLRSLRILALLLIVGLGVTKLAVAIGRGRTNIGYLLVFLALYTLAVLLFLGAPRATPAGRRYLDWLRESHEELSRRVASGSTGEISDLTLAAAIYGSTILPLMANLNGWNPRRRGEENGSSGGSGCGSGGGGGDSGGDGGGGDGGGGGCGGCGGGD